ncbi:hypothetical protein BCR43DRAFT_491576 [Syncephalastrum racemosum]|uniref:Ras-GEF domain-containing protein n=1 Tax=Syncephalastrum racemosum TaxID=13706 RepID=A0A1X2HC44_SYNRA|nr:hypothetical protein BCR43DRAFT_491576 [Syncephalastrum racemosum]
MATAAGGLPLVPLSPLTKASLLLEQALAEAKEKLAEAKRTDPQKPVTALRRLLEDTRVEANRLESIGRQIQSVQNATCFKWDPDLLARQIACVNAQLFSSATLQKNWLCQLDRRQTHLIHLVDFHRYLTHSIAHQLIYWAHLQNDNKAASQVQPNVHPKDNLIAHLVRVAYLQVHAYRDFSGFAAVMRALMLPEVRRLRKLWQSCSSRVRDMFRDLAQIMSPSNDHQAYHDMLWRKLQLFHTSSASTAGAMIAIPWVQPHMASIRSLVTAYTAGENEPHVMLDGAGSEIVLSAPGVRKLAMAVAVLDLCQRNTTNESADLVEELAQAVPKSSSNNNNKRLSTVTKPIHFDGLRSPVIPTPDLNSLAPGDRVLHHWLVSRVYLTKEQLIEESIEVEPLVPGEQLSCDRDEELEEQLERDMADADAALNMLKSAPPTAANSRRASITGETDDDDDDDDDNDNDEGDQSMFDIPAPKEPQTSLELKLPQPPSAAPIPSPAQAPSPAPTPAPAQAPVESTPSEPSVPEPVKAVPESESQAEDQQKTQKEQIEAKEMPEQPKEQAQEPQKDTKTERDAPAQTSTPVPLPEVPEQKPEPEVTEQNLQKVWADENKAAIENKEPHLNGQGKSIGSRSMATSHSSSTQENSAMSKQTKKSRLSPTAPEFVPTKGSSIHSSNHNHSHKHLIAPHHQPGEVPSSVVVSPASSVQDVRELAPLQNQPTLVEEEEEEDDPEEQWHGYPGVTPGMDNQGDDETVDSEEWNGYPSPPSQASSSKKTPRRASAQSDVSSEWKGYHAYKMEETWQMETELKVQEHDWQGYTLETLNEDELDSSTMMDGEFEKSRQARRQGGQDDPLESFKQRQLQQGFGRRVSSNWQPKFTS